MNTKRILTWGSFVLIIALVIWGLILAEKKANREEASIPLPDQVTSTDHVRGSESAKVTLVEYGDFQCPACAIYLPIVEQLNADFGTDTASGTMRFVFRHFPLSQHANAMPSAEAAEAAGMQGKFWEMYKVIYEKQGEWENAKDAKIIFVGYAKELGLDEAKFVSDMELQSVKDKINNDYKSGLKAGINSTPTFFLNGVKIDNPRNYDEFKKLIQDSLPKLNF